VNVVKADPTVPGPWRDLVPEHDAVVNLTGAPVTIRWNEAGKKSILDSRILSTRYIVDALSAVTGKTLLCANAVGYYGDGGDRELPESAPRGTGFLADVAGAWQTEALRARSFGHRVVLPRIAVALGDGGALAKLRTPFSLGIGGRLGSGRQWFPWIHVRDLVRVISFLLEQPGLSGPFNACSPQAVTNAEFTAALGRALKRPAILPVPAPLLRLVMGEAAGMLLSGQRCVPKALLENGFEFSHPDLDRALADIICETRKV
jgi:uncharacterized protein (TIGR01777 family)